jgi:arylsulfatase A-like enzyme
VASVLGEAGVSSTAVFAYRHPTLGDNVFSGFGSVRRPPKNDLRFRAAEVTDRALDDLRDPANARMHFLWVHYFDAHGPRTLRVLPPDIARFPRLPGEDPDSALYQSELAYDDREVGRLLEGIEQTGGLGKTLVVISSDHGEAFGLGNVYEHGQSAFEEVVHVPGILVGPGIAPGRYEHVVSHRDVAATIAGAFGLVSRNPRVEEFGRSWLRLRASRQAPLHRFVITYSASAHVQSFGDAPMVVRTDDQGKLAVGYLEGIERLYHLASSEGERRDVAPDYPDEAARDRLELEVYRDIDRAP